MSGDDSLPIPYTKHVITEEDIASVCGVLRSDNLTQGRAVEAFENALSSYVGSSACIAVSNGTAALHLTCLAMGLAAGDSLWTSPISFVASANCALYCGAEIDFVDIEPGTWNIDVDSLEEKLTLAEKVNKVPKILVVVHLAGVSCDMRRIQQLKEKYNFLIIEDACHALGGSYGGFQVGACEYFLLHES